jgi:membrane protein implicated in regulation of membrane protease activity
MIYENIANIWFLLSVALMVAEVVLGMTIVLMFASIGAFAVGLLVVFNAIAQQAITWQIAIFMVGTVLSTAIFFKPLHKLLKQRSNMPEYHNMVGRTVTLLEDISHDNVGNVEWSGSIFKAQLSSDVASKKIIVNKTATIVAVKNNVLIIKDIN